GDAKATAERVRADSERELTAASQRRDSINAQLANVRQMLATLTGTAAMPLSAFGADEEHEDGQGDETGDDAPDGATDEAADDSQVTDESEAQDAENGEESDEAREESLAESRG